MAKSAGRTPRSGQPARPAPPEDQPAPAVRRSPVIVGRAVELQVLATALAEARTGAGQVIFLVGEGGIGKSRLADAAIELARDTNMRLLRGRGSSIGPMVPFRSLSEALLSLIRDGGPVDLQALGPYRAVLAQLIPDWSEPADRVAGSMVILAEAVLRLLGVAGRDGGCLLVLDDLQDADAETLAVVEYLIDNVAGQPSALLATVRDGPGPAMRLARSAAQRGSGILIELSRLQRADLHLLAAYCLNAQPKQVPEAVADLLWAGSAGNPFLAEEVLTGMVGGGLLDAGRGGWQLRDQTRGELPPTFARSLLRRVALLEPAARDLLSVAAVLGLRFPLPLLLTASGRSGGDPVSQLHGEVAAQLVGPDLQNPGWYAFRHRLIRDALLTTLDPREWATIAGRAATAMATVYPGLPGQWCQAAAQLLVEAGDPGAAGQLFVEAGRRALAEGAATSAVALLDRAGELLPATAAARTEAAESVLYALAEAGMVEQARDRVAALDRSPGLLDARRRARLHTRLAWAEAVSGQSAQALAQVRAARTLLGSDAEPAELAPIDVVEAHLALGEPSGRAEQLARNAAVVAEAVPLPVVACQAWQVLGAAFGPHDPDQSTACLERAHALAVQHQLPIWVLHALVRLGNDDALREANLDRLEQAHRQATRVGAVSVRYLAEATIALHQALRGEFVSSDALAGQVFTATTRLRLLDISHQAISVRAIVAAHRGRRREMDQALAELRGWSGAGQPMYTARVHGLARTFCALLEEDPERARDELATAVRLEDGAAASFALSGQFGMRLLLAALAGELDRAGFDAITASPANRYRWDRQFALFARAVLAGRTGDLVAAEASVVEAVSAGAPYTLGRNLGLRLVGQAALLDGWGRPVDWLRQAENYFHTNGVPAVAGACRALLRSIGEKVAQHRRGSADIPTQLRTSGVTVREYEVLRCLSDRLGNREIADRLYLSPRTVERHISSLISKTGLPNRVALSKLAEATADDSG